MTYITKEIYDVLPILKVGTAKTAVEITSEPFLKISSMGFLPCIRVKVLRSGLDYTLVIGAKSLGAPIEALRSASGEFTGIKIDICKESDEKMAKYQVFKS